jgi:hypothetical protein
LAKLRLARHNKKIGKWLQVARLRMKSQFISIMRRCEDSIH